MNRRCHDAEIDCNDPGPCAALSAGAFAEELDREQTIDGECSFTVQGIKDYDVFFNQASGSSKQYIVLSFKLLNRRTEQFFVKTETSAKLVYDGDFEFEPDYLWTNPEGSYFRSDGEEWLYIYGMTDDGKIYSNGDDAGGGYEHAAVNFHNGYRRDYNPEGQYFDESGEGPENSHTYMSKDESKTMLDPLVERTYHYVFLVPDIVAEEEGMREMYFTVNDEEYSYRF